MKIIEPGIEIINPPDYQHFACGGEMKVYLAKVGGYYESSFWEGVFFDKKQAYREAWRIRNSYIQDNGRNGHKFEILGIWVDVKLMEVR